MKKEIPFKHVKNIDQSDKRSTAALAKMIGSEKGAKPNTAHTYRDSKKPKLEQVAFVEASMHNALVLAKGFLA